MKGYTLVELLVAIALIGILAAIGIPVFANYLQVATINAGAQEMRTGLQQAKRLAIATRQSICVQGVTTPFNGYQFLQGGCAGAAWVGPGTTGNGTFRLQNNVTIAVAAGPPVFTALGVASPAGQFRLTGPNGTTQTVTVLVAGRITTP